MKWVTKTLHPYAAALVPLVAQHPKSFPIRSHASEMLLPTTYIGWNHLLSLNDGCGQALAI